MNSDEASEDDQSSDEDDSSYGFDNDDNESSDCDREMSDNHDSLSTNKDESMSIDDDELSDVNKHHTLTDSWEQGVAVDPDDPALSTDQRLTLALMKKIRKLINMIKKSSILTMFVVQECQLQNIKRGLSRDLRTRWNSSYSMIDALIHLRGVIEKLFSAKHWLNLRTEQIDTLTELEISSTEWNYLTELHNILQGFFHATKTMSGRTYPSIGSAYFILTKLKIYLTDDKSDSALVKRLKNSLAAKIVSYFEEDRSQLKTLKVSEFLVDYFPRCLCESQAYFFMTLTCLFHRRGWLSRLA